jgi:REP element-mobilizing transposase RayT
MASTYLDLHYHLVFSTKFRRNCIPEESRKHLHRYMAGVINGLGGSPLNINGTNDHVHLLVRLRATHCLADLMRELKKSSSIWMHRDLGLREFNWQTGYSAFTVSARGRQAVWAYIENQEAHHQKMTFCDELTGLLKQAGIDPDAQFQLRFCSPGVVPRSRDSTRG